MRSARRRGLNNPARVRPQLETLEDRTLLSATPDFGSLAVDAHAYNPAQILVRFRDAEAPPVSVAGTEVGPALALVPGLRAVRLIEGVAVADALERYRADPSVLYAEPDYRVEIQLTPNDPRFNSQWPLNNTGQTGGTPDADIDAVEAWDVTTGNGTTVVAVIDTGVDYTHPDLAGNMWTNAGEVPGNGLDDDNNGFIDDIHGYDFANNDGDPLDDHFHGTHVAGTIGAVGNNGVGVTGVSWNVQIMALKFLDGNGSGYLFDAVRALDYAVANGAHVSNNSWGGGGFEQSLYDAINRAGQAGHVFVAAAGNDGSDNDAFPAFPASYNLGNVVAVAATDHADALAGFSNYGANSVDLGAPGVNIHSTFPTYVTPAMSFNGLPPNYGTISGTSMATPHVTGVVALVHDLHPGWSYDQIIDQVLNTTDAVGSLAGRTRSGGRLNATGAVGNPPADTSGPYVTASSPSGSTTGPVGSVRLTFSEAVTSFDTSDVVSFTGPGGAIPVTAVTAVNGSNGRQFDVTFDPQSGLGAYSLVVGPDIYDLATPANAMNQDRDGTSGEVPDDRYTAAFTISDVLEFPSGDVPAPILDFNITISYLTIDQDVGIADLDVRLDITHTYDGDLYIHLISPDGTDVLLSQNRGGAGDDFRNTTFDDEATVAIAQGSAPFAGSYRSEQPLSQFDGQNARGTWQLWIEDWGFFDEGTLNAWALRITPGDGPPPPDNSPPDAVDDFATTPEDTPVTVAVLDNDSDPDGDPLTVTSIDWTQNGTAAINPDGTVTFTPSPDFYGSAAFGYTIDDGRGGSDSAAVTIDVAAVNDAPVAVDDQASTVVDTPVTFGWGYTDPPLEANDLDADGDWLWVSAVVNASHGTAALNGDGSVTFTPEVGYVGVAGFDYTVTDGALSDTGHVSIDIAGVYYLSLTGGGSVTGTDGVTVSFTDADILRLAAGTTSYGYQMYFDGSDVGLTTASEDIDAFAALDDGSLLISTVGAFSVPGVSGGGEDLLRFVPTSVGDFTAGSWSLYFDGSDVGLSGTAETLDGVAQLADGRLLISTAGAVSVPGVSGADTDLLAFTPTSLGNSTAGSWSLYFDGSDVGLTDSSGEDTDALFVQESAGMPTLYLSTRGNFAVPGVSGANEDVVRFRPTSLGSTTAGSYGPGLTLDGSRYGLAAFDIDGIHLGPLPGSGEFLPVDPVPGGFGGFAAEPALPGGGLTAPGTAAPQPSRGGGSGLADSVALILTVSDGTTPILALPAPAAASRPAGPRDDVPSSPRSGIGSSPPGAVSQNLVWSFSAPRLTLALTEPLDPAVELSFLGDNRRALMS